MFNIFTDAIENILDTGERLIDGELPTKRQVAKLLDAGFTIAGIAAMFDVSAEYIEYLMEDKN